MAYTVRTRRRPSPLFAKCENTSIDGGGGRSWLFEEQPFDQFDHFDGQLTAPAVLTGLPHEPNQAFSAISFAEFEADLIRLRTREGMKIARAKGRLRGRQPKLSNKQQKELGRFGVPTEGIHVTLTWRSNAPKHVTLLEYVSGLAAFIPAAPTTSPAQSLPPSRPADHIPATGDDIGYVLRTLPSD